MYQASNHRTVFEPTSLPPHNRNLPLTTPHYRIIPYDEVLILPLECPSTRGTLLLAPADDEHPSADPATWAVVCLQSISTHPYHFRLLCHIYLFRFPSFRRSLVVARTTPRKDVEGPPSSDGLSALCFPSVCTAPSQPPPSAPCIGQSYFLNPSPLSVSQPVVHPLPS